MVINNYLTSINVKKVIVKLWERATHIFFNADTNNKLNMLTNHHLSTVIDYYLNVVSDYHINTTTDNYLNSMTIWPWFIQILSNYRKNMIIFLYLFDLFKRLLIIPVDYNCFQYSNIASLIDAEIQVNPKCKKVEH